MTFSFLSNVRMPCFVRPKIGSRICGPNHLLAHLAINLFTILANCNAIQWQMETNWRRISFWLSTFGRAKFILFFWGNWNGNWWEDFMGNIIKKWTFKIIILNKNDIILIRPIKFECVNNLKKNVPSNGGQLFSGKCPAKLFLLLSLSDLNFIIKIFYF